MRKTLSASQMQALDRWAIEEAGIPAICLMENAGRLVADEAVRLLKGSPGLVTVVCGRGNNGGDGFVAARHLLNRGREVAVLLAGKSASLTDEALVNFLILRHLQVPILAPERQGMASLARSSLIIDALFGIGLSRNIEGKLKAIVHAVNAAKARVISVDAPSGLDATTGRICGVAVKADVTLALAYPKTGCFCGEGPRYAGKIKTIDIGIPYGHIIE